MVNVQDLEVAGADKPDGGSPVDEPFMALTGRAVEAAAFRWLIRRLQTLALGGLFVAGGVIPYGLGHRRRIR